MGRQSSVTRAFRRRSISICCLAFCNVVFLFSVLTLFHDFADPEIRIVEGLHLKVVNAVGPPGMAERSGKIKITSPKYSRGH